MTSLATHREGLPRWLATLCAASLVGVPALAEDEVDWGPERGKGLFVELIVAGSSVTGDISVVYPDVGYQAGGAIGYMEAVDAWRFGIDFEVLYYNTGEGIPIPGPGTPFPATDGVIFLTHMRGGYLLADRLLLYGKIGVGGIHESVAGLSDTVLAVSVGAGAHYYLTDTVYVLFDTAWVSEVVNGPSFDQVRYGGGLGFSF